MKVLILMNVLICRIFKTPYPSPVTIGNPYGQGKGVPPHWPVRWWFSPFDRRESVWKGGPESFREEGVCDSGH